MERFVACFTDPSDSRASNASRHDFHELLIIALCTVLCGGQTSVDMALYAETKAPYLRGFLRLKGWVAQPRYVQPAVPSPRS